MWCNGHYYQGHDLQISCPLWLNAELSLFSTVLSCKVFYASYRKNHFYRSFFLDYLIKAMGIRDWRYFSEVIWLSHRHACLQLKAKEESWSDTSVKSCHLLQNHCYLFQNFEPEYGKTGSMPFTFSLEPDTNLDALSVARYWLVTII